MEEEQVWKCPKHPSKRRRSGVCPVCLRQRLAALCPDCATARPCSCSSSPSSCSSSTRFFSGGAVGRVSNLIDSEPAFRRSRSLAVPFLRSTSIWSLFKTRNSNKCSGGVEEEVIDLRRTAALKKSSSVAERESKSSKGRGWHFPSPIKMFRSPMYRG